MSRERTLGSLSVKREMIGVIDVEDDDANFISLIEEVEAQAAIKAKRQKTSPAASISDKPNPVLGPYTAALRCNLSSQWEQQQQELKHQQRKTSGNITNSSISSSNTGGGACFKCGMSGHWARDCGAAAAAPAASVTAGRDDEVEEKQCPCGSGACLVRVSNTPKNPGRKFYRCPFREENGGCNFFEWCDSPSRLSNCGSVASYQPNSSGPDLPCPCGAGSCSILVARTGKNAGKQYYRCPNTEGRGCGFFKWCNEPSSVSHQSSISLQAENINASFSSSQSSIGRTGSSCFKCGQGGHWARDCTMSSSESKGSQLSTSGSGTCFRCGKAGHWARDCNA